MVISIVTRKTSIADRQQWRTRLDGALASITAVLESQSGFVGVEYLWGAQDDGLIAQVTRWRTLDDCQRYVRNGAAATVAMHEERALPSAPQPDGAWVRRTFEAAEAGG